MTCGCARHHARPSATSLRDLPIRAIYYQILVMHHERPLHLTSTTSRRVSWLCRHRGYALPMGRYRGPRRKARGGSTEWCSGTGALSCPLSSSLPPPRCGAIRHCARGRRCSRGCRSISATFATPPRCRTTANSARLLRRSAPITAPRRPHAPPVWMRFGHFTLVINSPRCNIS